MLAEKWEDRSNFPKFTNNDEPGGPRRFTTTLKYLRAWRGQFTYEDHEAPWSVVARNIDINMGNLPKYHGTATFTGGTVAIQNHVPFWANMKASYEIDGGQIHLNRIEFDTDGAKTIATGDVDLRNWPQQSYQFKSHVQFARMRQLFFKDEKWELSGEGDFAGTVPAVQGRPRTRSVGHVFERRCSASTTIGSRRCTAGCTGRATASTSTTPARSCLAATAGSRTRFDRSARRRRRPRGSVTSFQGVDLAGVTDFQQLKGLRFAGTASGEDVVLEWPLGKFSEHRGGGRLAVEPPAGVQPMTASLAAADAADADHAFHEWGPFAPAPLPSHLPIAGDLTFRFDPEQVYIDASRFATEHTHVTFQGATAWGDRSRLAFHVTSDDWQESDQLLAGIMSDFGAPRNPVTFGGRGEFDGTMTGPFRAPRVEGEFSGEDLRGFDTLWGGGSAHIVVENDYVRVTDGVVGAQGLGDALRRPVLARVSARRRRRRNRCADPRRASRPGFAAPRVRHRRLPRVRICCRASFISPEAICTRSASAA